MSLRHRSGVWLGWLALGFLAAPVAAQNGASSPAAEAEAAP